MRRRFGRGRRGRGNDSNRRPAIDAKSRFEEIAEAGIGGVAELTPLEIPGVPGHMAVVAEGTDKEGRPVLVGFSPESGGEAALAVAAAAGRQSGPSFDGDAVAIAPQWSIAARRRLAWLRTPRGPLRAVVAPAPQGVGVVDATTDPAVGFSPRHADLRAASPEDRDCFERAARSLEGLAAKHGGAIRRSAGGLELVVLAARTARLRFETGDNSGVVLDAIEPERYTDRLSRDKIATVMDRLEGHIRKRANDRRVKNGEAGLRANAIPSLLRMLDLRRSSAWPFFSGTNEVIDVAGVDAEGRATAALVREKIDFEAVGQALDSLADSLGSWSVLFEDGSNPLRTELPRLVVAARDFDEVALDALAAVTLDQRHFDLVGPQSGVLDLVARSLPATQGISEESRGVTGGAEADPDQGTTEESNRNSGSSEAASPGGNEGAPARSRSSARSSRSRNRGGGRNRRGPRDESAKKASGDRESQEASSPQSFEEISAFDFDEEGGQDQRSQGESPTRRRRRRRRRRSSGQQDESDGDGEESRAIDSPESPLEGSEVPGFNGPDLDDVADDLEDPSDTLTPMDSDVPDVDQLAEPVYEEDLTEGPETTALPLQETEKAEPSRPRRRVAIVVEATRSSILAGVLLGRELRLVEGIWVYPQSELMTFFRSVATDLVDSTPIHVVGFVASPSREVLQAASLYADRLDWYDHHEWPPEDLGLLTNTLGADRVHVHPGAPSSLPMVLAGCTRRSRFSDKLVELQTGRFSDHDYERWGRLWWHRLGEIAKRPGERQADLAPLFSGRPSDLAREASQVPAPELPPEVTYASNRDFRLVHFGGYLLVIVPTSSDLDCNLVARIVRERYDAAISLAYHEGGQTLILAGDDSRSQRGLNLKGMVESVAAKHDWVEPLPDDDFVACMHVKGLAEEPDRLEELIRDIAMARSVLET
ncbi:hypothetical protein MK489_09245 [Myxococcota bacterium]|nr:hypothetical protein [Myxococcota bacterium]